MTRLARPAAALAFLAMLSLGLTAGAAGRIAVQVTQVLASDPGAGEKSFDPQIAELASHLDKYSYRTFKKAGAERKDIAAGGEADYRLSEAGFVCKVKASESGKDVLLEVSILNAQGTEVLRKTRVKVRDGGTTIIAKELESKQGCLFLAFTVKKG